MAKKIQKKIKNKKAEQKKETKEIQLRPEKSLMLDVFTGKNCPKCKTPLFSTILSGVEVDYCPKCFGLWFEEDELRWAKDEKDKDLQWLDIDLWKNEEKFKISYGIRICPSCRVPLYEVYYGKSGVIVDVCNLCRGIWLDRAEFKKIIDWLKKEADYKVLNKHTSSLFEEFAEIFIGPETLREEILDFIAILKLLKYKFLSKHPVLSKIILQLPK